MLSINQSLLRLCFVVCTIIAVGDSRSWSAATTGAPFVALRGGSTAATTKTSSGGGAATTPQQSFTDKHKNETGLHVTPTSFLNNNNNNNTLATTNSTTTTSSSSSSKSSSLFRRFPLRRLWNTNFTTTPNSKNREQADAAQESNTTASFNFTSTTLIFNATTANSNETSTSSTTTTATMLPEKGHPRTKGRRVAENFALAPRKRWQQGVNFTKRLIYGDIKIAAAAANNNNNNGTTTTTLSQQQQDDDDDAVFVFSSKRGKGVQKINATTTTQQQQELRSHGNATASRLPGPLRRLFRGNDKNNPSKSSSSQHSSWNPFDSPSTLNFGDEYLDDEDDVNVRTPAINQTNVATGPGENKTATKQENASSLNSNKIKNSTETDDDTVGNNSTKSECSDPTAVNVTAASTSQNASQATPPGSSAMDPATSQNQNDFDNLQPYNNNNNNMPMYGTMAPNNGNNNNNIVFFNGQPYLVVRPGRRGGVPPGSMSPPQQGGGGRPHPTNAMIFGELVGTLLGTAIRVWILTWLAHRLAHEEETIQPIQRFVWERVNDRYERDVAALKSVMKRPPAGFSAVAWRRRQYRAMVRQRRLRYRRARRNWGNASLFDRTVLVVPLAPDKSGNLDVPYLTDAVSFLIQQHRAHAFGTLPPRNPPIPWWKKLGHARRRNDIDDEESDALEEVLYPKPLEIVLLVQSPGGGVSTYGLAAAQVRRLAEEPGILLTVSVDQIAASGGYMIASQAHQIVAAPFATLGSIGVIMEGLNFHEIVRKYGIHPIVVKSGANKNPLSTYGKVTEKEEKEEQERLTKVHEAFKRLVVEGRPVLADTINQVGDGSVFVGQEAMDLQLVDRIQTSEEYIMERVLAGDRVLRLHRAIKPKFTRRINLSPLDILPHIRNWVAKSGWMERVLENPSVLVTLTSALQMARYIFRQYVDASSREH